MNTGVLSYNLGKILATTDWEALPFTEGEDSFQLILRRKSYVQ